MLYHPAVHWACVFLAVSYVVSLAVSIYRSRRDTTRRRVMRRSGYTHGVSMPYDPPSGVGVHSGHSVGTDAAPSVPPSVPPTAPCDATQPACNQDVVILIL